MKNTELTKAELLKEACDHYGINAELAIDENGEEGVLISKSYSQKQVEDIANKIEKYIKLRKKVH